MLGTPKYSLITKLILLKWSIKDEIQEMLHLEPPIKVTIEAVVKDKNGKIIKKHRQHSHSFVSNYLALVGTLMSMSYYGSFNGYWFQDINGNWQTYNSSAIGNSGVMAINDSTNDSSYGIVVGTGTTPPTASVFNMPYKIVNGTGSGQLQYGAHLFNPSTVTSGYNQSTKPASGTVSVNGNTTSFNVQRTFTNNSGSAITVSEVGIIAAFQYYNQSSNSYVKDYVLIVHDLLSSPVTIPNGSSLTLTYTFQTTT
jgi:hypothetical protein